MVFAPRVVVRLSAGRAPVEQELDRPAIAPRDRHVQRAPSFGVRLADDQRLRIEQPLDHGVLALVETFDSEPFFDFSAK